MENALHHDPWGDACVMIHILDKLLHPCLLLGKHEAVGHGSDAQLLLAIRNKAGEAAPRSLPARCKLKLEESTCRLAYAVAEQCVITVAEGEEPCGSGLLAGDSMQQRSKRFTRKKLPERCGRSSGCEARLPVLLVTRPVRVLRSKKQRTVGWWGEKLRQLDAVRIVFTID